MDITTLCLDTGPLIAYLKGREPAATAVAHVVQEYTCYVTAITTYTPNDIPYFAKYGMSGLGSRFSTASSTAGGGNGCWLRLSERDHF